MSDSISTSSSSVPIRADGDLQLQLKNLAPLKNARPHASRAGPAAPGDALKHILDSVPFTPSQGVRTPSPRRPNVRDFDVVYVDMTLSQWRGNCTGNDKLLCDERNSLLVLDSRT